MVDTATDGFVETEIGLLPSDWLVCKLGECCTLGTGGTPSRAVAEYWNGDIPWVKTGEITYTTILETEEFISQQGLENSAAKIYPAGTLLVAMYGQGVTRGRAGILGIDAAINQACAAISVSEQIRSDFLFYALKAHYERIRELGHGANQRNLNMQLLRGVEIPVPPIDEQRAIAIVLRTVQKAKEATEKVITASRQLKLSLMQHLFTYGPVPFQEAEHIELQDGEIGEIPTNWRMTKIEDVASLTQYGISKRGETSGAYPILRMNNLGGGRVDYSSLQFVDLTDDEFAKFKVHRGDVLFNRTNSFELVGKTSLFESDENFVFASYLVRVTLDDEQVDPAFVNFYMNTGETQRRLKTLASRAVSQSNINATKLKGFMIPFPDKLTQSEIAKQILAADQKIQHEVQRHKACEELFNSMLHDLMTGQRRVHELDLEFTEEEAA